MKSIVRSFLNHGVELRTIIAMFSYFNDSPARLFFVSLFIAFIFVNTHEIISLYSYVIKQKRLIWMAPALPEVDAIPDYLTLMLTLRYLIFGFSDQSLTCIKRNTKSGPRRGRNRESRLPRALTPERTRRSKF